MQVDDAVAGPTAEWCEHSYARTHHVGQSRLAYDQLTTNEIAICDFNETQSVQCVELTDSNQMHVSEISNGNLQSNEIELISHNATDQSIVANEAQIVKEDIRRVLRSAKLPLPCKSRGRPKGSKQFRCSGAVSKSNIKESIIRYIVHDSVNVSDVVQHR